MADTLDELSRKFAYIFDDNVRPLPGTTKPQGRAIPMAAGETASRAAPRSGWKRRNEAQA